MIKDKERTALAAHFNESNPLRVLVVTLSDRAFEGTYEDKSGPLVRRHLDAVFDGSGISVAHESLLLNDDAVALQSHLQQARSEGIHLVVTTGGTGVGPRDITTDVVLELADKTIPGIMEAIRIKYAIDKPCAQLSRTVAAIIGNMLLYAIPGSTKGVDEYMAEIVKSLPHTLCVLHELDPHG